MSTATAPSPNGAITKQEQPPASATVRPTLLGKIGERFGVEPEKMIATLKQTAFRQRADKSGKVSEVTNEQMMALLVVADQYNLNPWTKEIYAFPSDGGIMPIVGVDGWIRMMNEHPQFNGVEFVYGPEVAAKDEQDRLKFVYHDWVESRIFRKDREHPYVVREFHAECYRNTGPWNQSPRRMLRHKALIQCARLAFGFAGITDEDDAERIYDATAANITRAATPPVGRVAHSTKPAPQPQQPVKQVQEVVDEEGEVHPFDEQAEILRQELIASINEQLDADLNASALKDLGEKIRVSAEKLGPDVLENFQRRYQAKLGSDPAFSNGKPGGKPGKRDF